MFRHNDGNTGAIFIGLTPQAPQMRGCSQIDAHMQAISNTLADELKER